MRPIHKNENQQPRTIYPTIEYMGWYKIWESYKHKKGTCHDNGLLHLKRLWPMPLQTMTQCIFVGVFLENVSHEGLESNKRSCPHNLANSHRHKFLAYYVLVMVETDSSKSNVAWRHENMGQYTDTCCVSMCGWQHKRVNMASQTFDMSCKYMYVNSYRQPNKHPQ